MRSIKLQYDSHRDIYGSASIWSSQFMVIYILSILAWHSILTSIFIVILLAWSKRLQSDLPNLYPYKQNNHRDLLVSNMSYILCLLTFAWHFLTYAFLIHSSTLIKASSLSISSCSWKASHYRDQSKIINSCLICYLPNMLAFTWCYDIPQHRSHFIDSIYIVVFVWARLFP